LIDKRSQIAQGALCRLITIATRDSIHSAENLTSLMGVLQLVLSPSLSHDGLRFSLIDSFDGAKTIGTHAKMSVNGIDNPALKTVYSDRVISVCVDPLPAKIGRQFEHLTITSDCRSSDRVTSIFLAR